MILKRLQKNISDYKAVFWGAHAYCRHTIHQTKQAAGIAADQPGELNPHSLFAPTIYSIGRDNVGSIWKIDGRGDTRFSLW